MARKYRLMIIVDDDTYPAEDLRELIESEGIEVTSFSELRPIVSDADA